MKKMIFYLCFILMSFSVLYGKEYDKRAQHVDSEPIVFQYGMFDVKMSFRIEVMELTPQKPTFLVVELGYIPQNNIPIHFDYEDSLYMGVNKFVMLKYPIHEFTKFDTRIEEGKGRFRQNIFFFAIPSEDLKDKLLFKCTKMRFFTHDASNYDIMIPKNLLDDLEQNYKAVLGDAEELYRIKTDKTYGF